MSPEDIQNIKNRFGIIGNDDRLNRAVEVAYKVASTDLSVLVTGESGVGKEFFPKIIHQFSGRKHGPYIPVNCGAIPEGTVDSELFGHEKGSFTGAVSERKGFFEVANGGTIFLDEVGELPLTTQVRLLRVLETGEFLRVGSSKPIKTNVRVVAATNLNMEKAVKNGTFREDLYYRLNTISIQLPSLRDRGDDAAFLFRKFALNFAEKYSTEPVRLTEDAVKTLLQYHWPGNVRQLRNIVDQISILEKDNKQISRETLLNYIPVEDHHNNMPILSPSQESGGHSYAQEREFLYSVLFDLQKQVTNLKHVINELVSKGHVKIDDVDLESDELKKPFDNVIRQSSGTSVPVVHDMHSDAEGPKTSMIDKGDSSIQDVEVIDDSALRWDSLQKDAIRRALEKHGNQRRAAAKELNISERTLYRKIKEYGLE
ncbi:MAG: sigma 54-interacting transcriptional regulator [Paludibacteraceae bacterium]|nr:sigma 54-interacting transcriptional regulator [Paludibacteraceae bacterium]